MGELKIINGTLYLVIDAEDIKDIIHEKLECDNESIANAIGDNTHYILEHYTQIAETDEWVRFNNQVILIPVELSELLY